MRLVQRKAGMEGDVVKAAWVLGGSLVASVVLAGAGLFVGGLYFSHGMYEQFEAFSKRSAEAVMTAPKNTSVTFLPGDGSPIKVGFEPKLPAAVRLENSMDEARKKRAVFEVEVKPTLDK